MPVGKVGPHALGKLGGGLGSIKSGTLGTPLPQIEGFIILEDDSGYILLEDNDKILTET